MTDISAIEFLPEDVAEVVEDIRRRQREFGFKVNRDSVNDAIASTCELYDIQLSEAKIKLVCNELIPGYFF
jgi:hypothetical protein